MRINPNLFGKSYLDLIPNSYDSSTRKCEAAEGKILGVKELTTNFYLAAYH